MTTSFESLYGLSRELENIAAGIQRGQDVGLSPDQIEVFIEQYHHWFAEAMALLPADLAERFRAEYEGGTFNQRIKAFLASPTEVSVMFKGDAPPTSGMFPYWQVPFESAFKHPIQAQRQILLEGKRRAPQENWPSTLQTLQQICRRFSLVAGPLAERKRGKAPYVIQDEYDVQDLLHGLLRLFFDDVRPENAVPSQAGANSRVDFLLRNEKCLIEAKFARLGHAGRDIGAELAIDIERYRAHPDRGLFVALVYDPERVIENPRGLEDDLTGQRDEVVVAVFVAS